MTNGPYSSISKILKERAVFFVEVYYSRNEAITREVK